MELTASSASDLYRAAITAARSGEPAATGEENKGASFVDTVKKAATETVNSLGEAEKLSSEMVAGKAEPHSVVEALAAAELALETAVAVRDKVVSAYQEILRMPV